MIRDADIILFSMIVGEALASLAAAEFNDFCVGLETMTDVVRIVRSCCSWCLCVVRIGGM